MGNDLAQHEGFVQEQSGGVDAIARQLWEELQARGIEDANPFAYADVVDTVVTNLHPDWQDFLETEERNEGELLVGSSENLIRLFQRYLKEKWHDRALGRVTVPLLNKLVLSEQHKQNRHRYAALGVRLHAFDNSERTVDDKRLWSFEIKVLGLSFLEEVLERGSDGDKLKLSSGGDFALAMRNLRNTARNSRDRDRWSPSTSEEWILANPELAHFCKEALREERKLSDWLQKALRFCKKKSGDCSCLVVFESPRDSVGDSLNVPVELLYLPPSEISHWLFGQFEHKDPRFLFLDQGVKFAVTRRFRPSGSDAMPCMPLRLSDLRFRSEGKHLPKLEGHIVVMEDPFKALSENLAQILAELDAIQPVIDEYEGEAKGAWLISEIERCKDELSKHETEMGKAKGIKDPLETVARETEKYEEQSFAIRQFRETAKRIIAILPYVDTLQKQLDEIDDVWMAAAHYTSLDKIGEPQFFDDKDRLMEYLRGLDDKNWHFLHIIGHGEFVGGLGGQLAIGQKGNTIPLGELVDQLRSKRIKGLFFEACETAMASGAVDEELDDPCGLLERFVQETSIPTLLGFRWIIDLGSAGELFTRVYENWLYRELELPIALYKARVDIRDNLAIDPRVWVSPVLVYQDFDRDGFTR